MREFLLMIYKGDDAKMLNTTVTSVAELRTKVLARWGCSPEESWTVSLRSSGGDLKVVEGFGDLPSPKELRGRRKTRAKLQIDKV